MAIGGEWKTAKTGGYLGGRVLSGGVCPTGDKEQTRKHKKNQGWEEQEE